MISKELMGLVSPHGENEILRMNIEGNRLEILYEIGGWGSINLDTLGRMCKEWCLTKGYPLNSGPRLNGTFMTKVDSDLHSVTLYNNYVGSTEVAAIINASKWVMEQRDDS